MNKKYSLARNLRKNATFQERLLWKILRNRQFYGLKFKRQQPIGNYIVDFVCEEKSIIIELDGGHHNEVPNINMDNERTLFLTNRGYKVLRFWNNEVNENLEGVYRKLQEEFGIETSP